MSKLLEHTNKEYKIIQEFINGISAVPDGDTTALKEFTEEIKADLIRVMETHYDYNSLKNKYYRCRESMKKEEE